MDPIGKFQTRFRTVVAGVIATTSSISQSKIASWLGSNTAALALILMVSIIIFALAETLLSQILDRLIFVRCILYGRSFIEGVWIDVVVDKTNRAILFGGVLLIEFENGQVCMSGESFDCEGKRLGSFGTTNCWYERFRLKYNYKLHTVESNASSEMGYGESHFARPAPAQRSSSYSGFFIDTFHSMKVHVEGELVNDPDSLSRLSTLAGKRAAVLQLIARYARENDFTPILAKRPLGANILGKVDHVGQPSGEAAPEARLSTELPPTH